MNRLTRLLVAIIMTAVLVTTFLGAAAKGPGDLTSFWTIDLDGNDVTQQVFASHKLTLINIWATFCPPCLQEMPALAQLSDEYASKGVQVIGIVTDVYHTNQQVFMKNMDTARQIIDYTGADYLHLLPSMDLHEKRLQYSQVVPETFFVDSTGKIVGKTYYGAKDKSAWKKVIDSTLALLD